MSEHRVSNESTGNGNDSLQWRHTSQYKTRAELSRLLDDLHASLPALTKRHQQDQAFWPAFEAAGESIKRYAMGFNLDFVIDRIEAMKANLGADSPDSIDTPLRDAMLA